MPDNTTPIENDNSTKDQELRTQDTGPRTQDTGPRTQYPGLEKNNEPPDTPYQLWPAIPISTIAETLGIQTENPIEDDVESSESFETISVTTSGENDKHPYTNDYEDYSRLGRSLDEAYISDEFCDTKATMEVLQADIRRMKKMV